MNTVAAAPLGRRRDAEVIGLIGLAHGTSHFFQLLLPPLFPWLAQAFGLSFIEVGLLMTVIFVVSGVGQALAGFVVDRYGARRVLFGGLACLVLAATGFALSISYPMLLGFAVLAGIGNCVFHPVDFSILNARVHVTRLGHGYSVHGITGSLGWATAPIFMVSVAQFAGWRAALGAAAALGATVLFTLVVCRNRLESGRHGHPSGAQSGEHAFAFLRLPAVWMCFLFFFGFSMSLGAIQTFAPQAALSLHGLPIALAALCVSVYMLSSAGGMVLGGFLLADPTRSEKLVAAGFGAAAVMAVLIGTGHWPSFAVLVFFGFMGFGAGIAGPSRDLLVKQATPANATGRVYGVVYSGLDVGMSIAPALFGALMDAKLPAGVFLCMALFQTLLIASAFNVKRYGRQRQKQDLAVGQTGGIA